MARSTDRPYDFLLVRRCKYSSILCRFFSYLTLNNIVTLTFGLEITRIIQIDTIRKLGAVPIRLP